MLFTHTGVCKRNVYVAVLIAVTVQVSEVHSTVAAVSSICTKAKECYVDETSAKVCNRMKTTCNPCVSEKENESVFASFAPTEYICFDVNDDGDCPTKTTNCPTIDSKTSEEEDPQPEVDQQSSYVTDPDESSKTAPTFASTEKKLISSSSESKSSLQSSYSNNEATPTSKSSLTEEDSTMQAESTGSSGHPPPSETPTRPTLKKIATSDTKSSTLPASEDEVPEDTSASRSHISSTDDSVSASKASKASSSPSPAFDDTHEAVNDETNPDQSNISPTVASPVTAPTVAGPTTKDTILSNKSDSLTTTNQQPASSDSKVGLILCIVLGAAAVVGFAGFVVWKKKTVDEDSDEAFSPSKSAISRNVIAQPSATSASTAYLAQPNQYGNKTFDRQYSNNYGNNYGGDNGYSNNYAVARYATGSSAGAAAGMVPANYGSPCSIDIDGGYDSRRTDSILGGTGVILSTKSGMMFSAGPSPANSDTNQDIWGNDVGSGRQKCTASSASVEF